MSYVTNAMSGPGVFVSAMMFNKVYESYNAFTLFKTSTWMNTISLSYISYRVPNTFCAQPLWGKKKCGLFDIILIFEKTPSLTGLFKTTTLFDACHKFRPKYPICNIQNTSKIKCGIFRNCIISMPHDMLQLESNMLSFQRACGKKVNSFRNCHGRPMFNNEIQLDSSNLTFSTLLNNVIGVAMLITKKTSHEIAYTKLSAIKRIFKENYNKNIDMLTLDMID
jgi:hypothetical protein